MINNWTLFNNSSSSSSGSGLNYIQDVFQDVTNDPNANTGLTSTASTNPLNRSFQNDDVPKYHSKTLYIKDYVLIQDRSKWVNGEPTYNVIWSDPIAPVQGYAWGDIDFPTGMFRKIGDGFGVGGVARKIAFIVRPAVTATATAQLQVDGVNGATIDFSNSYFQSDGYMTQVHSATNETYNLHDYRCIANQVSTLNVVGVVVYFENSGDNLDEWPGITYINKVRAGTASNATLSLPALGSSLGGRSVIYKTAANQYLLSNVAATMVQSIAIGSSGTNLVLLSTGTGVNYSLGDGITVDGPSPYVGVINNISTDTLTVGPTLTTGLSGLVYRLWNSGPTFAINASLMTLAYSLDFSKLNTGSYGTSGLFSYVSNDRRYSIWGLNVAPSNVDNYRAMALGGFGTTGFFQIEGYFSAAEIEYCGSGTNSASVSVNGLPAWSINASQTGMIKKTLFANAGPQWNNALVQLNNGFGTSLAITKINLYQNSRNIGVSFGALAQFDTVQSYVARASNATMLSIGMYQREFADRLYFYGGASSWGRQATLSAPGTIQYVGNSTNSSMRYDFYGKEFSIIGTLGSSYIFTLDGGGATSVAFNTALSAPSLGFHSIVYTHKNGTSIIQAVDYRNPVSELSYLQNKQPISMSAKIGQVQLDLMGPYANGGQTQTGALYTVLEKDIAIISAQMYVMTAGSTGISSVDVCYQNLAAGFTSIFFLKPSANATSGSNFLALNSVLANYPYVLSAGSILRLDVSSAQINGSGLLVRLNYQEVP